MKRELEQSLRLLYTVKHNKYCPICWIKIKWIKFLIQWYPN